MSNIAINPVTRRVQFTGNTGTGPFAFTFNALQQTDIAVFKNNTLLTLTTNYSVSLNANGTGSVSLGVALISSDVLTIIGGRELSRTTDFVTAGDLLASSLNEQLDSNVIMAQQLDEKIERGLFLNAGDVYTNLELPVKDARKGTVLGFNATSGDPEAGPNITAVQSLANVTTSINILGTTAAVEDMSILGTAAIVEDMSILGTSGNVTAMGLLGVSAVVTDMGILGTAAIVEDMALLGTSGNVSAMALLGTSAAVADMAILGTSAIVADMAILGTDDVVADMNILGSSDVVTDMNLLATAAVIEDMGLLATSANVAAMGHIGTSANVTAMGLLGTSAVVTDMGILGTAAIVEDMSLLGTSANVTSMGLLGTSAVVEDMGLLATSAVIEDMGLLATSAVIEDMGLLGTSANVTAMGNVSGSITNVNTVASNVAGVNSFAERYRIASSAPSSSLNVGDLYFDTQANELKVYKSSGWAAAGSTVNGTSARFHYDITGTPTTVTGSDANSNTLAYDAGFIDVYVNGVRMSQADINTTSGSSVVFASALAAGDEVDIVAFGTFAVANIVATGALNSGSITSGFGTINNGASAITTTGVGSFGSLDISGAIDVDGVTNLDVVDIDGAVDMASTLAVAGVVTANAGVVVDNFTLDGTTLALSSGDFTVDVAGDIILDADGGDIHFYDGGTAHGNFLLSGTDFTIGSSQNNGDLIFRGIDGGANVTALTLDMSDAGSAYFSNKMGIGTSTFVDTSKVQIEGAKTLSSGIPRGQLNISDETAVATGVGGSINFSGNYSGTDKTTFGSIEGFKDNGTGGHYGASLVFKTRADQNDNIERMRINSSGRVLIGTTTEGQEQADNFTVSDSGNMGMTLRSTDSNECSIFFSDATSGAGEYAGSVQYSHSTDAMLFGTAGVTRMTIGNSGHISMGSASRADDVLYLNRSGSGKIQRFYQGSTESGYIVVNGTSTSYSSASDYRLKTDAQPMVGATARVQALNPVNFEWIVDGTRTDGFLAHEAQAIVPEAVTGTKDAMMDQEYEVTPAVLDENGTTTTEAVMGTRSVPDMQGIDQSKIVPLLTAALREALTKIDDMETRLAALEDV